MIEIDASYGEGGGQIIRTALALSVVTGKAFRAYNIRQGRKVSGLKAQHIYCVRALEKLCGAKSSGVNLGSEIIEFVPGKVRPCTVSVDIGTSGSVSLLMQSLVLPMVNVKGVVKVKVKGGTSGKWAMPYDFFSNVFLPQMRRYVKYGSKLEQRGYYPMGGGKIEIVFKNKVESKDQDLDPDKDKDQEKNKERNDLNDKENVEGMISISNRTDKVSIKGKEEGNVIRDNIYTIDRRKFDLISQGNLVQIKGISHASFDLQNNEVAERQARSAKLVLSKLGCPVEVQTEYSNTLSTGSGITLWAVFSSKEDEVDIFNPVRLGADCLGEKGKKAEAVGKEAAERLIEEIRSGGCFDRYTADNIIPFLGFYGGRVKVSEITEHTKTNIWVTMKFLDRKFEIDDKIIAAR